MKDFTLEICTFSLDACIKAEQAGADRIELCTNADEGGTTASYSLIKKACTCLSIPIVAIIRPRGGNFYYTKDEFDMMKDDISIAKELGCYGVALSVLNKDCTVDIKRTKELVELAYPMPVTFIRGFDLTPDPEQAVLDIISTGCKRILTSGLQLKAEDNLNLLKKLIQIAGHEISIMPGSGINTKNIKIIADELNAIEYHASARVFEKNERLIEFGFGKIISCDQQAIMQMKNILNNLHR